MATREAYARVWAKYKGRELSIGVEVRNYTDGEHNIQSIQTSLEEIAMVAMVEHTLDSSAAAAAERRVKAEWPDRAYFIEVDSGPDDVRRGVQVFQPYGLPRTKPEPVTTLQHEPGCFEEWRTARGCHCGADHQ